MIQYVIFALLLLIWMKTETFNQNYVHGQTLSNENKSISDEDVKKILLELKNIVLNDILLTFHNLVPI